MAPAQLNVLAFIPHLRICPKPEDIDYDRSKKMQLVDNNDYEVYIGETKRSHRTTLCHGRGVKVVINEVIY